METSPCKPSNYVSRFERVSGNSFVFCSPGLLPAVGAVIRKTRTGHFCGLSFHIVKPIHRLKPIHRHKSWFEARLVLPFR